MAKSKIPDPLQRRHAVEGELDPSKALAIAEAYLAEDRALEAVAFFAKAQAKERIGEIGADAVEAGDAFLLREVAAALGEAIDADTWRRLADAAAAAGKDRYAIEARRQVERLSLSAK